MDKIQTLKGFRDIDPQEARKREYVLGTLRCVFSSFGFVPLETPTLEYAKLVEKEPGEEIEKLTYKFQDRGGRQVALRAEQTPSLARYIAQNKDRVTLPFKRYQISQDFRAEKPQSGRYREFTQIDLDIVGADSPLSDAEFIATLISTFEVLGLKGFKIVINDRQLFADLPPKAVRVLDKWDKIGTVGVKSELKKEGFAAEGILKRAKNKKPTPRLKKVFEYLTDMGIEKGLWQFDPLLARGLDYYTNIIFEARVTGYKGSIGGGGRYDKLIGDIISAGGEKRFDIPAIGIALGLNRLVEVLDKQGLVDVPEVESKVLITIFSEELTPASLKLLTKLQGAKVAAEIYSDSDEPLQKQLKYADKKGIPYAAILGPEEIKKGEVTVKDLKTGEQKTASVEKIIQFFSQPAE